MTKIKLNPAFEEFRGKMAGMVYRMRYGRQTGSKAPQRCHVEGGTPVAASAGSGVCPRGNGG